MKIRPAPILPRLPQAEFEQLKASIAEHGILTPLLLAMDGTIIDGNERYRALIEIGGDTRKIPLRVFGKMTEGQRKEYAIRCNCERRQLTRAERNRLLLEYIRAAPEKSTRAIADACRVPHRTAARAKATCATGTPTVGRDGKTYGPRPAASSSESVHGAGLIGRFLGDLEPGEIQGGVSPRKLKKRVYNAQKIAYSEGVTPTLPADYRLHLGDFREKADLIPDSSIDLGWTDPPWSRPYNHLLPPLFEQYCRILKPGALVALYVGVRQIPAMITAATAAGLHYYWLAVALNAEGHATCEYGGNVCHMHRPILIFKKPGKTGPGVRWLVDVIRDRSGESSMKTLHQWMQPIDETIQVLEALARPGCTVADLCAGSATSAVGCIRLGMRWVGCEIDPEAHKIASNRIKAELKARGGISTPATAKR